MGSALPFLSSVLPSFYQRRLVRPQAPSAESLNFGLSLILWLSTPGGAWQKLISNLHFKALSKFSLFHEIKTRVYFCKHPVSLFSKEPKHTILLGKCNAPRTQRMCLKGYDSEELDGECLCGWLLASLKILFLLEKCPPSPCIDLFNMIAIFYWFRVGCGWRVLLVFVLVWSLEEGGKDGKSDLHLALEGGC